MDKSKTCHSVINIFLKTVIWGKLPWQKRNKTVHLQAGNSNCFIVSSHPDYIPITPNPLHNKCLERLEMTFSIHSYYKQYRFRFFFFFRTTNSRPVSSRHLLHLVRLRDTLHKRPSTDIYKYVVAETFWLLPFFTTSSKSSTVHTGDMSDLSPSIVYVQWS